MKIDERFRKKWGPCEEGWNWFMEQKETDSLKVLKKLLAIKSDDTLSWANWLIVRTMTRKQYLSYAIYAAEQVIDIYEKQYPNDNRPRLAIDAAKAVLKKDTPAAWAAAWAAAEAAAMAAWAAAEDAARAAGDAAEAAAMAAARAAARAAGDAAWAAAMAAGDAAEAAGDAAEAAARAAARAAMKIKILKHGISLIERYQND